MTTYATFAKNAIGREFCNPRENDFCGECVSFVRQYIEQVFGVRTSKIGNACDYYNSAFMNKYFDKVPAGQEQNGDILCWKAGKVAGEYGHIGIRYAPGKILSQNYNYKKYAATDPFFSTDYQGAMRIKKSNPPKGGDDVITSDDINILRAGMRDVKGWNAKNVDAGKNDIAELAAWVDKTWEQYFTEAIKEGASWRKRRDAALSYYATKAATDKKVATLTLSVKTLTSQNKSLSDVNKQLSAQADIDAEEIANLEKQLSAKPTAVDEKVVVENWLVRLWNSLFKR